MANTNKDEYIKLLEEKLTKQVKLNQEMLATLKEQENEILCLQAAINRIKQSTLEVAETIEKLDIEPDQFINEEKVYSKVTRLSEAVILHN
jgi:hypothetical protein